MPRGVVQRKRGKAKERDAGEKKGRLASIKNRIRSVQRLLRKELPAEVKIAQEKKLEELQAIADEHAKGELERMMALRYRKVKFFERRKVERRIRRVERQQRALTESPGDDRGGQQAELTRQSAELKEDLEYIRFFPKTERYVSLFMGDADEEVVKKRRELRLKIKDSLAAAAAAGNDLEETGSEDDGALDMSEDEFFLGRSSSDEADADDERGDDTSREQAPLSAAGPSVSSPKQRPAAGKQQRHRSQANIHGNVRNGQSRPTGQGSYRAASCQKGQAARALMPPPGARSRHTSTSSSGGKDGSDAPSGRSRVTHTVQSQSANLSQQRRKRTRPKKKK